MDSESLLTEAHGLALAIAPELQTQPLYVMAANELAGLPCGGCCLGWASADMFFDRAIADRLGSRYRGPGNLFVLDLDASEDRAKPGGLRHCANNVAIHEVAHIVPFAEVFEPPDTPRVRELQLQRMDRIWSAPDPNPGEQCDPHDHRFIRRAVHLAYRAAIVGGEFCWDRLFGPYSWMASPEHYLTLLLRECRDMSDCTFRQIDAIEPPAAFSDQWKLDLSSYHKYYKGNELCRLS